MTKFYQKKPIVIEAIQLDIPNNDLEVMQFIGALDDKGSAKVDYGKKTLTIPTLEGLMTASNGDFIVKGVNGEFYPCKPDIFDKTYQELKQ